MHSKINELHQHLIAKQVTANDKPGPGAPPRRRAGTSVRVELAVGDRPGSVTQPPPRGMIGIVRAQFLAHGLPMKGTHDGHI